MEAFQTRGVPVRDLKERIVEWLGALTDVQDAGDAQEKLSARERELAESRSTANRLCDQLRRLLDASIIGLFTTREYEIVDANGAFLQMLGLTREEFQPTGLNWRCLTPPGYEEVDEKALSELRETGECRPFEKE